MNHRHADFQSAALPLSYPGIGAKDGATCVGGWVIEKKPSSVQHSFEKNAPTVIAVVSQQKSKI